jgi:hypothetical protein
MSEQIDRKIRDWCKRITVRIGNVEVYDCLKERNTPLVIQGDLSSYSASIGAVRKEVKNAEPQRD